MAKTNKTSSKNGLIPQAKQPQQRDSRGLSSDSPTPRLRVSFRNPKLKSFYSDSTPTKPYKTHWFIFTDSNGLAHKYTTWYQEDVTLAAGSAQTITHKLWTDIVSITALGALPWVISFDNATKDTVDVINNWTTSASFKISITK